jgi:hypothetical protein
MAAYRLTPQRLAALGQILRHGGTGVMRVETYSDVGDFIGRGPWREAGYSVRRRTTISIEIEAGEQSLPYGLVFLEEDGVDGWESVPPVRPYKDYEDGIDLLVAIVKSCVRAWAMDENKIRFGLLELD